MENTKGESQRQLDHLTSRVLAEIDAYKYECPDDMVGQPLSEEKVKAGLEAFRAALVAPYWADIKRRDTVEQIKMTEPPVSRCAIVADDTMGTLLAFDPTNEEFLLATLFRDALASFGVSGDAVGCFMAR